MNDQNEALLKILPDITSVSTWVADKWDGVEADDLIQDVCVYMLAVPTRSIEAVELSAGQRRKGLRRIARRLASEQREDYDFFRGFFLYSTDEVRDLLDNGALSGSGYEVGNGVAVRDETTGEYTEATTSFEVEDIDARVALGELSGSYRETLIRRFVLGESIADTKSLTRAVDALTVELNRIYRRVHEQYVGPGSRKAISNSTAQYFTKSQEDHG